MIDAEALRDDRRLLQLFRGAVAKGLVRNTGPDMLSYFTAAEHALAENPETPGNLFAWIVCGRRWEVLKDEDEDRALPRLKCLKGIQLNERISDGCDQV